MANIVVLFICSCIYIWHVYKHLRELSVTNCLLSQILHLTTQAGLKIDVVVSVAAAKPVIRCEI